MATPKQPWNLHLINDIVARFASKTKRSAKYCQSEKHGKGGRWGGVKPA